MNESTQFRHLFAVRHKLKWGYVDETGKLMINYQFDDANEFSDGVAGVKSGRSWGLINRCGQWVKEPTLPWIRGVFAEGLAPIWQGDVDGTGGYIDASGKIVIPIQYDDVGDFSEGLAAVKHGGKYGYIDKHGNFVIAPFCSFATPFVEGAAAVHFDDDRTGYIKRDGEWLIPPKYYSGSPFSQGLAQVYLNADYSRAAFIDRTGEVILEDQWDSVSSKISDGLIAVMKNGKPFFIDRAGEVRISFPPDAAQTDFYPFSEGLAAFCVAGPDHKEQFGYIDLQGRIVVPARFDEAESFDRGLARVKSDGVGALINKTGRVVWKSTPDWHNPLQVLDAIGAQFQTAEAGHLTRIGLGGSLSTDKKLAELARIRTGLKSIEEAYLAASELTGEGLIHLKRLSNLAKLDISDTQITDESLKQLAALTKLRSLTLQGTRIDAGVRYLSQLRALEVLNLSDTDLTDDSVRHLAGLRTLRSLDLSFTKATDAGTKHLGGLKRLERLDLMQTAITDDALQNVRRLSNLIELNLAYTAVTDQGMKYVAKLTRLKKLELQGTEVTEGGLRLLHDALPQLKINLVIPESGEDL